MKARLLPVFFENPEHPDFLRQVANLQRLFADEAEILAPAGLSSLNPGLAEHPDAVVFPQMLGNAFRMAEVIRAIPVPRLVITSEFGTMSMWDWEIDRYLRGLGIEMIAPYHIDQTRAILRALAMKRMLGTARMVTYQDAPGQAGFQDEIFRRFYWWESECSQRMQAKFGVTHVKKSFKTLGENARAIPDAVAQTAWAQRQGQVPVDGLSPDAVLRAFKLYLAVRDDIAGDPSVLAVGINCLNESFYSDTTPCLAWNLLFDEQELIWGCEGDTVSMLTKLILQRVLRVPVMMSNLYPFLMGQAAVKHERIPDFPAVADEPHNHILVAHCGYLGVLPQSFATDWTLRKKVLAIVGDDAIAIDARFPVGDLTLAKLDPDFQTLSIVEGALTGYAQFPGSDCLNGAILKVPDGHRLMEQLSSHHYILAAGHHRVDIQNAARILGLNVQIY